MDSTTVDLSSNTNNENTPINLTLLKENPEVQQLLLLALSQTNQLNDQSELSVDGDKRKFDQLNTHSGASTISSLSDHGSPGSDTSADKMLGRPGRKPLTEEEIKMSDMDPKSKRKAQNRVAQRAFRERRVNYVKELEEKIKAMEEKQQEPTDTKLMVENRELKRIIQQLQTENAILGGTVSFDFPLSKLTNNGLATTTTDARPQKLLRSIRDDSTATLFSATTAHHNDDFCPSPDAAVSFATHNHSTTDNESSPSVSSLKSRSLTPPDTAFADDDAILFSSATPTDILNSFDTSQLMMNPFTLDQDLFNTLATTDSLATKPTQFGLSSSSYATQTPANSSQKQHVSTRQSPPPFTTTTADDSFSNDLIESLLVTDDDGADSSLEAATDNNKTSSSSSSNSTEHGCNMDVSKLPQQWEKLTQHPRFDEFDIDKLCDEMKRKALCSQKTHDEYLKETLDKYYPNGESY